MPYEEENEIVQRFANATGLSERHQLGVALLNKAVGLYHDGSANEALVLLDDVIQRFRASTEHELKVLVPTALQYRIGIFRALGRDHELLATCEEIIARFGGDSSAEHSAIQLAVGEAYFAKAHILRERKDFREAKIAYLEARSYLDASEDLSLQRLLAKTLINFALTELADGSKNGARICIDELDARFSESQDSEIQAQVARIAEIRQAILSM